MTPARFLTRLVWRVTLGLLVLVTLSISPDGEAATRTRQRYPSVGPGVALTVAPGHPLAEVGR